MKVDIKKLKDQSQHLRLLYVEDDKSARDATMEMLERFFSHISTAVDGQDGLDTFKNSEFDLILTDINMPRMTGIEMIEEIKKIDEEIPVLVISAYNDSEFFHQSLKLGVDDYIVKPIELNQFLLAIQKISLKKQLKMYQTNLEHEVEERTKELKKKLYYDDLTSLFNRYSFFEDIKNVDVPAIFVLDIDKFKVINEIYGVETGSLVLKEFGSFLSDFTKETSFKVYRMSSDEFLILDEVHHLDISIYEKLIEDFFEKLSHFKVMIDNDSISLEVSIGISIAQEDTFECAKIALEFAKENKKPFMIYFPDIDKRQEKRDALVWKDKIKSAIDDKRIIPVFQPIVNKSGEILKYEILMRLVEHEVEKLITPYFFLDIAIKTRLYDRLSSTIIFHALELVEKSGKTLSINFTFSDIKNKPFIQKIAKYLHERKGLGKRLVFEITESESIESYNLVKEFIHRFRAYGVEFAIDDFGSGFSNFEYILEIKPDYLKIDGSLIKHIDTDESSYILVQAIIDFSHKLGIKVIAEYVHNEKVFTMLKELNVDEYQGFYFYEPSRELV